VDVSARQQWWHYSDGDTTALQLATLRCDVATMAVLERATLWRYNDGDVTARYGGTTSLVVATL